MQLSQTLTRPAYDVSDLLNLVPVGRTTIYEDIKTGRLRATKLGRRTIFLADDIVAWLECLRAGSNTDQVAA